MSPRPVTTGTWQQTDLLGVLGMVEPALVGAEIQVADRGDGEDKAGDSEAHGDKVSESLATEGVCCEGVCSEGNTDLELTAGGQPGAENESWLAGDLPGVDLELLLPPPEPASLEVIPDAFSEPQRRKEEQLPSADHGAGPSLVPSAPPAADRGTIAALEADGSNHLDVALALTDPAPGLEPSAPWGSQPASRHAPDADPASPTAAEPGLPSLDLATPAVASVSLAACVTADARQTSDCLPTPPETLLILDTETTALRPEEGQCIEVGAVLFQVPLRAVLTQVSFLLPCDRNPAETVNGIPAAVTRLPQPWPAALVCFEAMLAQADAVLAHNASFDRQWFGRGDLPRINLPWICSMEDIRWPPCLGLRSAPSVQSLALAHGVPVWAAHRALTDCTYLVQVLQRCADLEQLLAAALEPRSLMRAEVSYADRHLAREAGFRWDQPVARAWTRRLSRREALSLPFPVHPVDGSLALGHAC